MKITINTHTQILFSDCVSLWDDHDAKGVTAKYLSWRYSKCFGNGIRQIALYEDGQLVGQAIVFAQKMVNNGNLLRVAQLGDLVVKKEHRSLAAVRAIYKGLRDVLHGGDYDFAFTLPNERSIILNRRFLKMTDAKPMRSCLGFHFPAKSSRLRVCRKLSSDEASAILAETPDNIIFSSPQIHWNRESLLARIGDPIHEFGMVSTDTGMLLISKRKYMHIPVVLIMAAFQYTENPLTRQDWSAMMSGAVSLFHTPFAVYTSSKYMVGFRGIELSKWHSHAQKPVQILNLGKEINIAEFSKLELIDTDVA